MLIEVGDTQVLCTASVEDTVPPFLRGKGQGWVTAEYGMLPRSTHTRSAREAARGKQSGRTQEIQRLIGRSLRAVIDLKALGPRTITIDCDVLQADGGTRTASITGGYVALAQACEQARRAAHDRRKPAARTGRGRLRRHRRRRARVGSRLPRGLAGRDRHERGDATAAAASSKLQGTAEGHAFRRHELDAMLALAAGGIERLFALQTQALADRSA